MLDSTSCIDYTSSTTPSLSTLTRSTMDLASLSTFLTDRGCKCRDLRPLPKFKSKIVTVTVNGLIATMLVKLTKPTLYGMASGFESAQYNPKTADCINLPESATPTQQAAVSAGKDHGIMQHLAGNFISFPASK
jgi:hypothetical protein